MGASFLKNQKTINIIGRVTAIAAVIIFIISCSLDLYSYSITPTATPTPSNTPTLTRTPRPTITASATLFSPTNTPEPTLQFYAPEFFQGLTVADLLTPLIEEGFSCDEAVQEDTSQMFRTVCQKTTDFTLQSILILSPDQVRVALITADLQKSETASDDKVIAFFETIGEIVFAQITNLSLEITPVATASLAPESGQEPEALINQTAFFKTWLSENLFITQNEVPNSEIFSEISFSLYQSDNHIWLEIGSLIEDD